MVWGDWITRLICRQCEEARRARDQAREERDYWRKIALGPEPLDADEIIQRLVEAKNLGEERGYDGLTTTDLVCAYNRLVSEQLHELKQRARKAESRADRYRAYIAYLLSSGIVDIDDQTMEHIDEAVERGESPE